VRIQCEALGKTHGAEPVPRADVARQLLIIGVVFLASNRAQVFPEQAAEDFVAAMPIALFCRVPFGTERPAFPAERAFPAGLLPLRNVAQRLPRSERAAGQVRKEGIAHARVRIAVLILDPFDQGPHVVRYGRVVLPAFRKRFA